MAISTVVHGNASVPPMQMAGMDQNTSSTGVGRAVGLLFLILWASVAACPALPCPAVNMLSANARTAYEHALCQGDTGQAGPTGPMGAQGGWEYRVLVGTWSYRSSWCPGILDPPVRKALLAWSDDFCPTLPLTRADNGETSG